jgi:low affinity Fe/Cu permease
MARRRLNGSKGARRKDIKAPPSPTQESHGGPAPFGSVFAKFAHTTALYAGKPATFLSAVFLVIVWGATGPIFGYSDTWQLVINTSTTIITFLMVFVIQNSQNRDGLAIQIKLAELIVSIRGPENSRAIAEDLSEEELEKLHEEYKKRAEATFKSLEHRRASAASEAKRSAA